MTGGFARVVDAVNRASSCITESLPLRHAVLRELRELIDFEFFAWILTDPRTEVGCAPLAEVPQVSDLPRLIRLKYLTALNRWTTLDPPVASLLKTTGGDLEQSPLWREMLARHGVRDVASVVFRDRFGCWGFLDLWRTGAPAGFSDAELALLRAITGPVTHAIRRAHAATFDTSHTALADSGPAVLVLTDELQMQAQTPATEAYLRTLVPPSAGMQPIPAGAYNVAAQLIANEADVDRHRPTARVHLSAGVWVTLRASRMNDLSGTHRNDIAVAIEPTAPVERTDMFMRAHGLSNRESNVMLELVAGADTRTIADHLFISEHTVQDHLKSIFTKTGSRSRRELIARATGAIDPR